MRSYPDGTIPSSHNAFSPSFLERISERDEPPTAGEADVAGPWHLEEIPDGWALLPVGASLARGDRPYAIFGHRWAALLAAQRPSSPARAASPPSVSTKRLGISDTP